MKHSAALTERSLVWRSLAWYWRPHLALIAGIIAATAVMTGAFVVGDSVRYSLQQLTLKRLQGVDYSLTSPRFFRLELADEFQELIKASELADVTVAPVLQISASASVRQNDALAVVGQVNCFGVDERGRELIHLPELQLDDSGSLSVLISSQLADELSVTAGQTIMMSLEIPSTIPRNSLLGERDVEDTTLTIEVKVAHVLTASEHGGRFSLFPNQQLPKTVFFRLDELQQQLGLDAREASRRGPARIARINGLFLGGTNRLGREVSAIGNAQQLQTILQSVMTLEDLQLNLIPIASASLADNQSGISVESERMVLEEPLENALSKMSLPAQSGTMPMMVYLANEMKPAGIESDAQSDSPRRSMYSVVAGVDFPVQASFRPLLSEPVELGENDIVLTDWLATDLQVQPGDPIELKYNLVKPDGSLKETSIQMTVKAVVTMNTPAVADRTLTPTIEGITNAETFRDWKQPFEMDFDLITQRDETYWDQYKATPKAYVSLKTATQLWGSPFGRLTSYRIAMSKPDLDLPDVRENLEELLHHTLDLEKLGVIIVPIKFQGLMASQGTTDFTGLFIGFSFFIIISAAILIALLFRLATEKRQEQIGLLSALGWNMKQIQRLWRREVTLLILIGTFLGTTCAIGYAWAMLYGLKTWWIGAIGTNDLELAVRPASLILGAVITIVLSYAVIWMSFKAMTRHSARQLMLPRTSQVDQALATSGFGFNMWCGLACTFCALLLLAGSLLQIIPETMAFSGFSLRVVGFFLSGMLMLTGGLFLMTWLIKSRTLSRLLPGSTFSQLQLGMITLSRNRSRSVMTTVLIASATFVIVAVTSGQQDLTDSTPRMESGNGGFTIVAQSSLPVLGDIDQQKDRIKLGIEDNLDSAQQQQIAKVKIYAFRLRPGEDASCLNLYQTQLPTILGVSKEFIERGGFAFASASSGNLWQSLTERTPSGNIPVFGDLNTLMYSLHKSPGQTIALPDQIQASEQLEVTHMLAGSVFQGVLLMSEEFFEELFPEQVGDQFFLVEVPLEEANQMITTLETGAQAFGLDAELVGDRLTNFLSVQNTYLSTFQFLGGLGLLLGTIGLGTVMLRNVLERQRELGLLRAVGFKAGAIRKLVLIEAGVLLILGLFWGTAAALISMAPHLASQTSALPIGTLGGLLLSVILVGMLSTLFAIRAATSGKIIPSLRSE